jgi:hypothetical protein
MKSDIYVENASNLTWFEAHQRISHDPLPLQRVVADVNEKVAVGPSLVLAPDLTITTRALVHNESSTSSNVPATQGISSHSTKYSVGYKLDLPSRGRRRTVSCKSSDLSVSTSAEGLAGDLSNTRLVAETSEVVDTLNGLPDLMGLG